MMRILGCILLISFLSGFFSCAISADVDSKPWVKLTAREIFSDRAVFELAKSVESGDGVQIKRLVNSGVDVNSVGLHNLSLLDFALFRKNIKSVRVLLELGANPNAYSDDGTAPLHTACALLKDPVYLSLLMEYGGDVNLVAAQGNVSHDVYPLHEIMHEDNSALEKLKILIDHGASLNVRDSKGYTPLNLAVFSSQYDLIYWVIQNDSEFHVLDAEGASLARLIRIDLTNKIFDKNQINWRGKVVEVLKNKGYW